MSVPNPVGGSGTDEGRDGWCTPRWLADVIGPVDLDPCSNYRSHIQARISCDLASGDDGLDTVVLGGAHGQIIGMEPRGPGITCEGGSRLRPVLPWWRVFVNPPYARGAVIRWIRHYAHTDFIFLLRWAPDTVWFAELWPKCWGAWFPRKCPQNPSGRINFEPPPGVTSSSNPFPHALYLKREPTGEFLDRLLATGYLVRNDGHRLSTDVGGAGEATARGVAGGGAGAGEGGERAIDTCIENLREWCRQSERYSFDEEEWRRILRSVTAGDAAGGEVPRQERPQRVRRRVARGAASE